MPNYRLVLEYDGTDFAGWQVQAEGARTVQGALNAAIEQITGEACRVTGSGRTDSGVHAEAQVASVRLEQELAPERLTRALNGVLPRDIGVRSVGIAADDFDALRSARRKRYRYQLWNAPERSPLRAKRFAHIPRRLDVAAMQRAAASLCGEHDFHSFRAAGSEVKTSVRTIFSLALTGEPGGEIRVAIEGSGFLRHMVRNIVGTLIEVGHGRRAADSMEALLAARDRNLAGPTAPACGLTLEAVMYSDPGVGRVASGVASIGHSTGKTPA